MTEADAGRDIESRAEADRRAEQARFRRSLSLMGMTLVLPGSAHLVAGNKRLGMIILRIWLVLVGVALFGVVLYLLDRNAIFSLATNTDLLLLARIVLILLAIAWILLLTDAWRLGDPLRLRRAHRAVMIGVNSTLCLVAGGVLLFSAHVACRRRATGLHPDRVRLWRGERSARRPLQRAATRRRLR